MCVHKAYYFATNYDYNLLLDALALRINVGLYITLGEYERMRDMMASALVFWTEDMTMYPFVLG